MVINVDEWLVVKRYLMDKYSFTEDNAESAANRLMRNPRIFSDFKEYCNTDQIPFTMEEDNRVENRVSGYTVTELLLVYGFSPVGAYLMLSELANDKNKAEQYLQDILTNGHETPIFNSEGRLLRVEFTKVLPPRCDECGGDATWNKENNRWYCDKCSKYLEQNS